VTFQPDYVKKRVMEYKKTFKKLFNRVNEIAYGFGDPSEKNVSLH
jgi:hypothetical protein